MQFASAVLGDLRFYFLSPLIQSSIILRAVTDNLTIYSARSNRSLMIIQWEKEINAWAIFLPYYIVLLFVSKRTHEASEAF